MSYAWIIDHDHLNGPGAEFENPADDEAGTVGPQSAPDWMIDVLNGKAVETINTERRPPPFEIYTFVMHDDDGILYYTGRMITDEGKTEQACFGPLGDYGRPNAGCVSITYPGHLEMDCS